MTADLYVYLAVVLTIVLSSVLGGNNFSTCLGASLGAGIVRMSNAILIASTGVLLGTLLEGYKLSKVFHGWIVPTISASGLIVVLVTSIIIMAIVTAFHLPLSLSQVMIGAGWGFALAEGVQVGHTYSLEVIVSWILSPAAAFVAAALVEIGVLRFGRRIKDVITLNQLYSILTLVAGFYAAYTLGANTLGFVVGLFPAQLASPWLLSLLFSASAIVGIVLLSKATVRSIADNLVGLNPSTALSAQFGGALTVHIFTQLGLPVSISQVVIGGLNGAASAKRIAVTNKRIIREIVAGWTLGPIAGAVIAFLLLKLI